MRFHGVILSLFLMAAVSYDFFDNNLCDFYYTRSGPGPGLVLFFTLVGCAIMPTPIWVPMVWNHTSVFGPRTEPLSWSE
jgi:hypothetical protein